MPRVSWRLSGIAVFIFAVLALVYVQYWKNIHADQAYAARLKSVVSAVEMYRDPLPWEQYVSTPVSVAALVSRGVLGSQYLQPEVWADGILVEAIRIGPNKLKIIAHGMPDTTKGSQPMMLFPDGHVERVLTADYESILATLRTASREKTNE